jgi:hypothetical protein
MYRYSRTTKRRSISTHQRKPVRTPAKMQREIADQVGCSQGLVSKVVSDTAKINGGERDNRGRAPIHIKQKINAHTTLIADVAAAEASRAGQLSKTPTSGNRSGVVYAHGQRIDFLLALEDFETTKRGEMSKLTAFDTDRAEVVSARQDVGAIHVKVRELENELLASLGRQLSELSVAISGIRDIGGLLEQLRVLRGKD